MKDVSYLIQAAIGGFFTNGLWLGRAIPDVELPYGVFSTIRDPQTYMSGPAQMQHERVVVSIYAADAVTTQTIADQVEAAMAAQVMDGSPSSFDSTSIGREVAPPDPETEARRLVLDFSVWFRPSLA